MNPRLRVALPAALTFAFGLGSGLVIGRVTGSGRQVVPAPDGALAAVAVGGPATATDGGGAGAPNEHDAHQHAVHDDHDPQVLRERLSAHEALVEQHPEDIGLLRTVGNYRGMLGENDQALAIFAKAEALARANGETTLLVDILTDQGVVLAEKGQYAEGFAKLDEAKATVPQDTRSRLTAALILLTRIMPAPPPGWDRKQAVERAESLLREVLEIEPGESNAVEMLATISSIRGSVARGNVPRPAAIPADTTSAAPAAGAR